MDVVTHMFSKLTLCAALQNKNMFNQTSAVNIILFHCPFSAITVV